MIQRKKASHVRPVNKPISLSKAKLKTGIETPSSHRLFAWCLHCSLLAVSSAAIANSDDTSNANIDRYQGADYMHYKPRTLYDMLEKIPGANSVLVAMRGAQQSRGFGSAGDQILINSKRVVGKENDLSKELNNIKAQDVDYIELIRGTKSGLDVQSKGLIVNVVLKKNIDSSTLYSLGLIKSSDMDAKPRGSLFYSSGDEAFKYRVGFEYIANPSHISWDDQYMSPQNIETDHYFRERRNWYQDAELSLKLDFTLSPTTQLQLNTSYKKIFVDADISDTHIDLANRTQRKELVTYDWHRDAWEISGDLSHRIDNNDDIKVLFISNRQDSDDFIWREQLHDNLQTSLMYRLPRLYTSSENVLRTTWKHRLDKTQLIDLGAELAINQHQDDIQFIKPVETLYHSTETNDIKENRYEAFVNYNVSVSSQLNVLSSLIYEYSTLDVDTRYQLLSESTSHAQSQTSRSFSYLKPRLNVRYDWDDTLQSRFNYERTVSQLNLNDFVPEFNRDESRLEQTNPNLKPEVRDELSFTVEKKWHKSDGSVSVTPYYHKITDLITEIPLVEYSGDGNVDGAKEHGVKFESNARLVAFGLDNTLVSASYTWRKSNVEHPFQNKEMAIERLSEDEWNFKLNQNDILPGLSFSLTLAKKGPYAFSRFYYVGIHQSDMTAEAFIDYQFSNSMKLRLSGNQLLKRKTNYQRTRFDGIYTDSQMTRYEHRQYQREPRVSLILSGSF